MRTRNMFFFSSCPLLQRSRFSLLSCPLYTAEAFIAAITQHIPEKSFQMVRYYGWYSNKSRGLRLKQGLVRPGDEPPEHDKDVEIIDVSEYEQRTRCRTSILSANIKTVWKRDSLSFVQLYNQIKR